jgi:hypothetical protein
MGLLSLSELAGLGDNGVAYAAAPVAPQDRGHSTYARHYTMPGARPRQDPRLSHLTPTRARQVNAYQAQKRAQAQAAARRAHQEGLEAARRARVLAQQAQARRRVEASWERRVVAARAKQATRDRLWARQRARQAAAERGDYGPSVQRAARAIRTEREWRFKGPRWAWGEHVAPAFLTQHPEYRKRRAQRERMRSWGRDTTATRKYGTEQVFFGDPYRELRASAAYRRASPARRPAPAAPFGVEVAPGVQPYVRGAVAFLRRRQ